MAEVVVQQGAQAPSANVGGVFSGIQGFFGWLAQYWYIIVGVLLIIAVIAAVIFFIYYMGLRKKRQDMNYVFWENTMEACKINREQIWILKKRRWMLLLWGLITAPIAAFIYLVLFRGESWLLMFIWMGFGFLIWLPFAWIFYKDLSMRILNCDMKTVGMYRGHARRMDGFLYIVLCIGKKWVVMEDNIILRLPEQLLTTKTVKVRDRKTKQIVEEEQFETIKIDKYVWNENGRYIFIPMTTMYKEGGFFYEPTLVEGTRIIDLRRKIAKSNHLQHTITMMEQEYNHLGQVTNRAVDANVDVSIRKKAPEKHHDASSGEEQGK